MKRTPLLISLVIVLLIAGGIWIYQSMHTKKMTAWDLIGNDAVLVIELSSFNSIQKKFINVPALKEIIASNVAIRRSLGNKILQRGMMYLSVHPTSRDEFGVVIYNEPGSAIPPTELLEFSKELEKDFLLKKRSYNGTEIYEFSKNNKTAFSVALIDGVFVMSESSFLLEGALKLRNVDKGELFKNVNASLFKLPTLQSDEGNVYLNVPNFLRSTKHFLQPSASKDRFSMLGSSLADVKINEDRLLMNGFVVNSEEDILSLFRDQQPQSMDMEALISNRVAAITHYGISNGASWFENQKKYLTSNGVTSTDSLERALTQLSVDIESIRKSLGNQFATCYLSRDKGVVNFIKLDEKGAQVSVFDELSSKISTQKKDSLYIEDYAGYQIKLIDYKNFLYQLFYPLAAPTDQSFFVQIGSYLMLSDNVELIKLFIDDIDSENTWGKSVDWNKFLGTSLQESNLNLFFDGKLLSVLLRNQFNARWKPFFDSTNFLGIDKGSAQLSRLESNFYLNASLQFSEQNERKSDGNLVKITYDYGSSIRLPAKVVRSHLSKENEIIIQDSLNNIYLLTKDLKTQWKTPVSSKIIDDVEQLDFFANGKLQYFFTTERSIHIIDRLGRYVDGFPHEINSVNIEHSGVVDYDRSKKYRYLLTDVKGNLFLTDKNAGLLEGWNPRGLNGKLVSSARHYRILGKDYFIAIQQSGIVNLMNRRGEMLRGFPMELGLRPSGSFFINVGNSLTSTFFTVVSRDGMKLQFGLDGQIIRKDVLLKRTGSSQFELVKSNAEDSYVFLRSDPSKLAIVDPEGKVLFEVENPGSINWKLTYIENRLKERFYCLYDRQQDFSYYYDSEGRLLLQQPLESTQIPTLSYDEKAKSLSIYNVFNSTLTLVTIKK